MEQVVEAVVFPAALVHGKDDGAGRGGGGVSGGAGARRGRRCGCTDEKME
jgi:hypothetical protein